MEVKLQDGALSVTVSTLGAEAVSAVYGGKERLWQNDNGSWTGHSPVLFPVCGHCGVTVNGTSYPIRAHGFAKRKEFTVEKRGENFAEFVLRSDEETLKVFPFQFLFRVRYTVSGNALTVTCTVENPATTPAYFFCGGHPSFVLEGGVENYAVGFEREEKFLHLQHDENGYLTGETIDFGSGKKFPLPKEYLQEGRTVIFGNVRSRKIALTRLSGEKVAELKFDGFPHLLLWRPNGANMICLEPWQNLPDRANVPDAEFSQKSGVNCVPQGGQRTFTYEIKYY